MSDDWLRNGSRRVGQGLSSLFGGLWEGVSGGGEEPAPQPNSNPNSALTNAQRQAAGGGASRNDTPAPQNDEGGMGWGTIIGAILTPLITNWLTSSLNLGVAGRGALTAATAAVGAWLGDWISDWFSGMFNKKAKDDPNSPARQPVAQVDMPSVPGGTARRVEAEPAPEPGGMV